MHVCYNNVALFYFSVKAVEESGVTSDTGVKRNKPPKIKDFSIPLQVRANVFGSNILLWASVQSTLCCFMHSKHLERGSTRKSMDRFTNVFV